MLYISVKATLALCETCLLWATMNGNQRVENKLKQSETLQMPKPVQLCWQPSTTESIKAVPALWDWWQTQTAPAVRVNCCCWGCDPVLSLTNKKKNNKFFLRRVSARLPAEQFCSTKTRSYWTSENKAAAGPFCCGEWEENVLFSWKLSCGDNVLT